MPAYDYHENGRVVTRILPVDQRDKFPNRITVPIRISVCPRGQPTQGDEVLRGFYRAEERYGTAAVRNTERALGLNASKVKKAWKDA